MSTQRFIYFAAFLLNLLLVYAVIGVSLNLRELLNIPTRGSWPFNPKAVYVAFAVVQTLYIIPGICGLLAVKNNNPTFLYLATFILLGIFVCLVVFGVVCIRVSNEDMVSSLFDDLKSSMSERDHEWLSNIQWKFHCCGIYSFMDWSVFTKRSLDAKDVPISCCVRNEIIPSSNCSRDVLRPNVAVKILSKFIYTRGCAQSITPDAIITLRFIGLEMLSVGFLTLLVSILIQCGACYFSDRYRDIDNPRDKSTSLLGASEACSHVTHNLSLGSNDRRHLRKQKQCFMKTVHIDHFNQNKDKMLGCHCTKKMKRMKHMAGTHWQTKNTPPWSKMSAIADSRSSHKKISMNPFFNTTNQKDVLSRPIVIGRMYDTNSINMVNVEEALRTKLETLYASVEKNTSACSTTPNPSSSTPFAALGKQKSGNEESEKHSKGAELPKSVTLSPNLANYSSLPLFHLVQLPTGEVKTLGQITPCLKPEDEQKHNHNYVEQMTLTSNGNSVPVCTNSLNYTQSKFLSLEQSSTLDTIEEESEGYRSGGGTSPVQNHTQNCNELHESDEVSAPPATSLPSTEPPLVKFVVPRDEDLSNDQQQHSTPTCVTKGQDIAAIL